jgi:hypothetical protein
MEEYNIFVTAKYDLNSVPGRISDITNEILTVPQILKRKRNDFSFNANFAFITLRNSVL